MATVQNTRAGSCSLITTSVWPLPPELHRASTSVLIDGGLLTVALRSPRKRTGPP